MSHTRGPWRATLPADALTTLKKTERMVLGRAFDGTERAIVDRVRGGSPAEADANTRLIAAAPEMLAALHEVAHHADDECGFMVLVRSAIAKAEGR